MALRRCPLQTLPTQVGGCQGVEKVVYLVLHLPLGEIIQYVSVANRQETQW